MAEEKINRYTYNIKGRSFYQKELVLGQLELLIDLLKGVEFQKGLTNLEILKILGGKTPHAMAIILFEEGCKLEKVEIGASGCALELEEVKKLTEFFANNVNVSLSLKVITDFFACTPMANIMQALASLIPATQTQDPIT